MALCSTSRDPLGLFTKHVHDDRSLQRDRLVSNPGNARTNFRGSESYSADQQEHDLTNFFAQQPLTAISEPFEMIVESNAYRWQHMGLDLRTPRPDDWASSYSKSSFSSRTRCAPRFEAQSNTKPQNTQVQLSSNRTNRQRQVLWPRYSPPTSRGPFLNCLTGERERHARSSANSSIMMNEPALEAQISHNHWEAVFAQLDIARTEVATEEILLPEEEVGTAQNIGSQSYLESKSSILSPPHGTRLDHGQASYEFQAENPFISSKDPYQEGVEIVQENGNLSLAGLAFEAACRLMPTPWRWRMLGSVLEDSEQEPKAIAALEESLRLSQRDPNNTDAMLRLAVCYTNEGETQKCCDILQEWLAIRYPAIPALHPADSAQSHNPLERYSFLKSMYIQAAQLIPSGPCMDANVQVALGILFFSTRDYQEAADCFAAAIEGRASSSSHVSDLHLLYNHYGACLGNMSRHDEAITAYNTALALKPNYMRARYNLGVAYYAQGNPKDGARQLLQRLRTEGMQIVVVGTSHGRLEEMGRAEADSSALDDAYEGLRRCCASLCRWDLAEQVGPNMDLGLFRKELET